MNYETKINTPILALNLCSKTYKHLTLVFSIKSILYLKPKTYQFFLLYLGTFSSTKLLRLAHTLDTVETS